jgi:hypothetical protein
MSIGKYDVSNFIYQISLVHKHNNEIEPYFPTFAGVSQGDPLSPLLFDVVGDGLALLTKKGQEEGLVKGLVSHLIDGEKPKSRKS